MTPNEFNWKNGRVTYWDLVIQEDAPLASQADQLKEDLVQVKFGNGRILDIGWYPEFSEKGRFVVYVIEDSEWEQPIFRQECHTVPELKAAIVKGIAVANS